MHLQSERNFVALCIFGTFAGREIWSVRAKTHHQRRMENIVGEGPDKAPNLQGIIKLARARNSEERVTSQAKRWTPERLGTKTLCIP